MTTPNGQAIEQRVAEVLAAAIRAGASDVHLRAGQVPMIRVTGALQPLDRPPFEREELRSIAERMTPPALREVASQREQVDFSAEWQPTARFRVHRFKVCGEPALVLRIIPLQVPDFAALRLPPAIKKVAALQRGLVLVTGATGMGKSTTIASLLDSISQNRCIHLLTLEDPIEFTIGPGRSIVSQREIGRDVSDFVTGLWAALREDPDVIFLGEIRDVHTAQVTLQAAETGHLVVSAIHTVDAAATIEHLVNLFPNDEQQSARLRLAECLEAVISQRLLPLRGRPQRVLATEVLLRSPSVQEWIRRSDKRRTLLDRMGQSAPDGMQTFDMELRRLYEAGLVELDTARAASSSPAEFMRNLQVM